MGSGDAQRDDVRSVVRGANGVNLLAGSCLGEPKGLVLLVIPTGQFSFPILTATNWVQ